MCSHQNPTFIYRLRPTPSILLHAFSLLRHSQRQHRSLPCSHTHTTVCWPSCQVNRCMLISSQFSLSIHPVNTIAPCSSQPGKRDGGEGKGLEGKYIPCYIRGNWCRYFEARCPSLANQRYPLANNQQQTREGKDVAPFYICLRRQCPWSVPCSPMKQDTFNVMHFPVCWHRHAHLHFCPMCLMPPVTLIWLCLSSNWTWSSSESPSLNTESQLRINSNRDHYCKHLSECYICAISANWSNWIHMSMVFFVRRFTCFSQHQ